MDFFFKHWFLIYLVPQYLLIFILFKQCDFFNNNNSYVSVIFIVNMAGLYSFFSILGSMRLFDFSAGISGTSTAITCKKNKTSVWQCQIVRHSWLRSKQTSVGLTGNNAVPSWTNASLHTSKHTEVNFKASEIINKSNLCTSGAFSSKYTRQ